MSISEINPLESQIVDPTSSLPSYVLEDRLSRHTYTKITNCTNLLKGLGWTIAGALIPCIGFATILTTGFPRNPHKQFSPLVEAIGIGTGLAVGIPTIALGSIIAVRTSLKIMTTCLNNSINFFAKSSLSLY